MTVAPALHAQCTSDENTNVVQVDVVGCPTLPDEFNVQVGEQTVAVKRSGERKLYSGTATDPFVIEHGTMKNVVLRGFRMTCRVEPKAKNDGPCVARYRLDCEPLHEVSVKSAARTTIEYRRQLIKPFEACDNLPGKLQPPATLDLSGTETVMVSTAGRPGRPSLGGLLTFDMFTAQTKWTLSDIVIRDGGTHASISNSRAAAKLREMTLGNVVFVKQ